MYWGDGFYVLDMKQGDVTGDGITDGVYLVGEKADGPDGAYAENIMVVVENGASRKLMYLTPKFNAGYGSRLFLGDFTGTKVADILVGIDSGGSGGYGFFYIYGLCDNRLQLLFDFEAFNAASRYTVKYRDGYRVEVTDENSGTIYTIDISNRPSEYLNQIYNSAGQLKEAFGGDVLGVSSAGPLAIRNYNVFDLLALQRITGLYNADTLGYVQTELKWDGVRFMPEAIWVAIGGEQLNPA